MAGQRRQAVIEIRDVVVGFGERVVLDHLSLDVDKGEILGFVGGSGSGKSVLLRTIIGLLPKRAGTIRVLGLDLGAAGETERRLIERRWGVLFQHGALFSSLTAVQNVEFAMREHLVLPEGLMREVALAKLAMVGLTRADAAKLPAELSGGMTKRVALARALALDPEVLFLDEPTSGLDPISAADFDALLIGLQRQLALTVVMITHDLDTIFRTCNRVGVIVDRKMITDDLQGIVANPHPWIQQYFHGDRAARFGHGDRVARPGGGAGGDEPDTRGKHGA